MLRTQKKKQRRQSAKSNANKKQEVHSDDEANGTFEIQRRPAQQKYEEANNSSIVESTPFLANRASSVEGREMMDNEQTNKSSITKAAMFAAHNAMNGEGRGTMGSQQGVNASFESDEGNEYVRSSELSKLIKIFAEKMGKDDNKNKVTIESFSKVIPDFDGKSIPVNQWLRNFDQNADAYDLNEKQKYVNARNKMVGTAKLFLDTITVYDYASLCAVLREEFEQKLSSAEVHKQLRCRKKRTSEIFHDYVLEMRKIAALGDIEEESVIRYIVDGIDVRDDLKFPLYSAITFRELRKKYELIETMLKDGPSHKRRQNMQTHMREPIEKDIRPDRKQQHCYNCGSTQHKRADCKEETKCFKCNGVGHMAKQCNSKQTVNMVVNQTRSENIKINGVTTSCLIDTGADVSIFYNQQLRTCVVKLFGLGNVATSVLGEIVAHVEVDGLNTTHTFLVVEDAKLNVDVIIGYDFLQKFRVTLDAGTYKFSKADGKADECETDYNILNVACDQLEIDVEPKYKAAVMNLLNNYKPVSSPKDSPIKLSIAPNGNTIDFRESPSRVSATEREFIRNQVDEWLRQGVIRKSCSDVASKVVLAKKKCGSYRLCVDFRKLNSLVLKDRFPVPIVDEVLEKMQNAKFFSVMDLKNGFFMWRSKNTVKSTQHLQQKRVFSNLIKHRLAFAIRPQYLYAM